MFTHWPASPLAEAMDVRRQVGILTSGVQVRHCICRTSFPCRRHGFRAGRRNQGEREKAEPQMRERAARCYCSFLVLVLLVISRGKDQRKGREHWAVAVAVSYYFCFFSGPYSSSSSQLRLVHFPLPFSASPLRPTWHITEWMVTEDRGSGPAVRLIKVTSNCSIKGVPLTWQIEIRVCFPRKQRKRFRLSNFRHLLECENYFLDSCVCFLWNYNWFMWNFCMIPVKIFVPKEYTGV
jgi:hypothetical protein